MEVEGRGRGRVEQENMSGSAWSLEVSWKCTSESQKGKTTYSYRIASFIALELIIISRLACKKCIQRSNSTHGEVLHKGGL